MSIAKMFGAVAIEGLHSETHRFPYATSAAQLPETDRDHFSNVVQRHMLWTDGGREKACGFIGRTLDR